MTYNFLSSTFTNYFLKKESTQFFISIAIRCLAIGMIGIYEPIYIYLRMGRSLSHMLLFFAASYGLFGLLSVYGGRLMARIGIKHTMLISHFFFFGYYISLFFLSYCPSLIILAIFLRAFGLVLFWPGFHTYFVRFSDEKRRAAQVGELHGVCLFSSIVGPLIGGLVLASFGYLVLFVVVLVTLLTSAIPLFLSRERYEIYTDSYRGAWKRIFRNKNVSLGLASKTIEMASSGLLWPVFMFMIGINYDKMGEITAIALALAAGFAVYMGRVTNRRDKRKLLTIGSFLLSAAWVIKYFVVDTLSAFLARIFYNISRTSADIPFQSIIYKKAALRESEADEFIVYREIILNLTRVFFFLFLAGLFYFYPKPQLGFIIAAIVPFGFMFLVRKNRKQS